MAGTSRVNREIYARFCGGLVVKFLRPTRREGTLSGCQPRASCPRPLDEGTLSPSLATTYAKASERVLADPLAWFNGETGHKILLCPVSPLNQARGSASTRSD